jgi:hypothetical protein
MASIYYDEVGAKCSHDEMFSRWDALLRFALAWLRTREPPSTPDSFIALTARSCKVAARRPDVGARSHGATDAEIEGLGIVLTATKRRMPLAGKRCSSSSAIFKSAGLSLLGTAPRSRGAWGMGGGQATHQQELFHQSGFFRGTELVRSLLRS